MMTETNNKKTTTKITAKYCDLGISSADFFRKFAGQQRMC